MISPEILRRYPFFGGLDDTALKEVAMISEEVKFAQGDTIYETGQPNSNILFLEEGCIESYLVIEDHDNPHKRQEYYLDDYDPGEAFGISAVLEPRIHTTTARARQRGKLIRIDADGLCKLFETNPRLGYIMMQEMSSILLHRLHQNRIQLVAAQG